MPTVLKANYLCTSYPAGNVFFPGRHYFTPRCHCFSKFKRTNLIMQTMEKYGRDIYGFYVFTQI